MGKLTKITISIGEDKAHEIIGAYLKNQAGPRFYYQLDDEIRKQIGKQVVKQFPSIVKATKQYKMASELDAKLKIDLDINAKNKAIFAKFEPSIITARKRGDEINREASRYYVETQKLHDQAVAESDAMFNAEFKKAGITMWAYKEGYIQYVEPKEVKTCANSCEASVES